MREIKFRAWDKLNKEMTAFSLFERPTATWGKHCEIMQFTGLLDKHGKEIYEGDIVKMVLDKIIPKYALCIVTWREEYAGFNFSHLKLVNIDNQGEGWSPSTKAHWEIIGNIYENPELLAKEDK